MADQGDGSDTVIFTPDASGRDTVGAIINGVSSPDTAEVKVNPL